jgi:DNA primase
MQLLKLDFIARAPEGYEVEELTRKQMIKALQNKRSIKDLKDIKPGITAGKKLDKKEETLQKYLKKVKIKDESIIVDAIDTIETGHSIGFNKSLGKLFDIPVGELFEKIRAFKDTQYLIIDGILTKRLLSLSINMKIKFIACKNKEEELSIPENIVIYYF